MLVGARVLVKIDPHGERLMPEAVSTVRAPEAMISPLPVISVIALSPETFRESVTVVEALRAFETLKVAMLEEALFTRIPAAVLVGARTLVATICQAPF